MKSNSLFIILGNHLFPLNLLIKYKNFNFFMAEDVGLCTYQKHHKLKIAFFLNAMRDYADDLKKSKFKLDYIKIEPSSLDLSYEEKLMTIINKKKIDHLYTYEIEDKFFEKRIKIFSKKNNLKYTIIESPMFINSRTEFEAYLKSVKKPFMSTFYKMQRVKNNILLDNKGAPFGGKWSFDEDNRKKIPKNILLPKPPLKKINKHFKDIKKIIDKTFKNHPGSVDNYWFYSKRSKVPSLLNDFIDNRFKFFGDYEDAALKDDNFLFHSFLSPYLNNGLITPKEVLDIVLSKKNDIPINSLEGFIRQIIGWREFMRGIYQNYSIQLETKNYFNNNRKLTKHWYEGTTGIDPIDDSIKHILKYGYTHHIIRLMYLSNAMNLACIDPKEIYKWFMEMFVDSSDWVMSPNVFGMGTYSDGGIFSTKPYICGSNYIIKMSNYKKGNWSEILDALYWNFISKNFNNISNNPRMAMVKMSYRKLAPEKLQIHRNNAKKFIKEKTNF